METITTADLKDCDTFKDIPEDQLKWMIDHARFISLEPGEFLFQPGEPLNWIHILLEGKIKMYINTGNQRRDLVDMEEGYVTGYLPFSRGKVVQAYGQVTEKAHVLSLSRDLEKEMIANHYELTQALVHLLTDRVREFTALQQQNEKMMALGKLSAGLAHELNNPAAAIVRGSTSLKKHLRLLPDTFKDVISIRMEPEHVDAVNNFLFSKIGETKKCKLSLLEKTDLEDELTAWMDERNVENSAEIAENLVEFDFTLDDLQYMGEHIPKEYVSPVLGWVNNNLVTEKMVTDIEEASKRISELVSSVKNYTHMDRAPEKQLADIHTGIRNTITMLNHRFRKNNVKFVENFDEKLPLAKILVSELNQVWTNLVDNALDALEGRDKAVLEIRTARDGDFVRVNIIDNGPGIPEEIRTRIYDPFFTTKEMGKGTGLGLDVVQRIMRQHNGTIKVKSEPGRTDFELCFPING